MEKPKEERPYNGIYQDIYDNFGFDIMKNIFEHYKGQSLSFPIRLVNPKWQKNQIKIDHENGSTVKELAKKYEYTEQRIRVILKSFLI